MEREKEKERASAVNPGGSDNEVLAATFTALVHASTKATQLKVVVNIP